MTTVLSIIIIILAIPYLVLAGIVIKMKRKTKLSNQEARPSTLSTEEKSEFLDFFNQYQFENNAESKNHSS